MSMETSIWSGQMRGTHQAPPYLITGGRFFLSGPSKGLATLHVIGNTPDISQSPLFFYSILVAFCLQHFHYFPWMMLLPSTFSAVWFSGIPGVRSQNNFTGKIKFQIKCWENMLWWISAGRQRSLSSQLTFCPFFFLSVAIIWNISLFTWKFNSFICT